ncbi:hypothetical protein ACWES4_35215, partial [Streptomyces sp. NPDC004011]
LSKVDKLATRESPVQRRGVCAGGRPGRAPAPVRVPPAPAGRSEVAEVDITVDDVRLPDDEEPAAGAEAGVEQRSRGMRRRQWIRSGGGRA